MTFSDKRHIATVLVVDDEPHIRAFVRHGMESRFKVRIAEAAEGETALTLCRETPPAAVVLDLHLPGMSGVEILRALRPEFPHLPILILSAESTRTSVQECLDAGATAYIRKDTPVDDMLDLVGSHLAQPALAGCGAHNA